MTFQCSFLSTADGNFGIWYVEDAQSGECSADWSSSKINGDDSILAGARAALTVSTVAGTVAGGLIVFEWLFCKLCCASCIEGLALVAAWMTGGATFMVYGTFSFFFFVFSSQLLQFLI